MRLIVLPCDPYQRTGYNRAVEADLERLGERPGDLRVVYLERGAADPAGFSVIHRPTRLSLKRAVNFALRRTLTEGKSAAASDLVPGVRCPWP
jgi:hypothetical protein